MRMIQDMRMRKLAPKTQTAYIRAVLKFSKYLGRSPPTASAEDLRHFQLHLVDQGCSPITLNATIVGLNFLFDITLGRPAPSSRARDRPWRRRVSGWHAMGPASRGFLPVRVLSRLFRRRFVEELHQSHRAGKLQFFGEYAHLTDPLPLPSGWRRCVHANGWFTRNDRSQGLRRCWPICRAIRTGWPSRTRAL